MDWWPTRDGTRLLRSATPAGKPRAGAATDTTIGSACREAVGERIEEGIRLDAVRVPILPAAAFPAVADGQAGGVLLVVQQLVEDQEVDHARIDGRGVEQRVHEHRVGRGLVERPVPAPVVRPLDA